MSLNIWRVSLIKQSMTWSDENTPQLIRIVWNDECTPAIIFFSFSLLQLLHHYLLLPSFFSPTTSPHQQQLPSINIISQHQFATNSRPRIKLRNLTSQNQINSHMRAVLFYQNHFTYVISCPKTKSIFFLQFEQTHDLTVRELCG